jgi:hypothetical protein
MFGFIKNWWYYNEYALLKQEYEKLLNDFDDYITMYEEVLGKNKKLEEDYCKLQEQKITICKGQYLKGKLNTLNEELPLGNFRAIYKPEEELFCILNDNGNEIVSTSNFQLLLNWIKGETDKIQKAKHQLPKSINSFFRP